ncbi:uncharacterized protein BJX67DRAFT_85076 [Aspergillus lucknowensis]|uniref:Uncharacterized protein n=1 Tax=Aspergillus lucknowensis TaxID=176173 RepID=A0ABR4LS74_9EURO
MPSLCSIPVILPKVQTHLWFHVPETLICRYIESFSEISCNSLSRHGYRLNRLGSARKVCIVSNHLFSPSELQFFFEHTYLLAPHLAPPIDQG